MRMIFRREAKTARKQHRRLRLQAALSAAALVAAVSAAQAQMTGITVAQAQAPDITAAPPAIDGTNWGSVTSPVFGTAQSGTYAGAELFAGPNQFDAGLPDAYFHGVIPNGKVVRPAGVSVQIGENPLGIAVTPDSKFIITSSDDERNTNVASYQNPAIKGGYALSVTSAGGGVVSHLVTTANANPPFNANNFLFVGLQVVAKSGGGYTLYASGGASSDVRLYNISATGQITAGTPAKIAITPILPANAGYASNYVLDPTAPFTQAVLSNPPGVSNSTPVGQNTFPTATGNTGAYNFAPPLVSGGNGFQTTFPAGSALSPNGRYLYVACNGDNSLAVIDTTTKAVVNRLPVGYFPYAVSVSPDGTKVLVSNTGIQEYKFLNATYNTTVGDPNFGKMTGLTGVTPGSNVSGLFYVPSAANGNVSTAGSNPRTSSVTVISVPGGDATRATLAGALYEGHPLTASDSVGDPGNSVGDTHPTATAIAVKGTVQVEYVAKSNSDSLGLILVRNNRVLGDVNLSPLNLNLSGGHTVHGTYPNALAVSPDNTRLYVAEAGLNSVAVLDISTPTAPVLLGRIPTGWYPSGIAVSPDGQNLYIINAKGVGEDINPAILTQPANTNNATGIESDQNSNFIFGTLQQVPVAGLTPAALSQGSAAVLADNFTVNPPADTTIVPAGATASTKIRHVIFILHENKTFDSMLGDLTVHFGPFASTRYNNAAGTAIDDVEYGFSGGFTQLSLNTQALAGQFATAVNYFSDSEESDAGHQFSASGTASDYTEKTLLVKNGRGLLVNKNFEPEDYPEGGYIFNNAARNGVSFKDYGALIRVDGTTNGFSNPSTVDDPPKGQNGYSSTPGTTPVSEVPGSDVSTPTTGLGQSYFLKNPILAVLGETNPNGEPHLDTNYPGYNFDISDQRRAKEFIADFDRMVKAGTLPTFLYIYEPNDHTGTGAAAISSTNIPYTTVTGAMEIADGDTGLGMVVQHLMTSPVYYSDPTKGGDGTGSAIFITYDDAQSGHDHVDPHRTPMIVVSPYAKLNPDGSGYVAKKHYVTASIVKTEELLMGLPPNNYGDLFATDLRDMFQPTYNGVTAAQVGFNTNNPYMATAVGRRVWKLAVKLDSSGPDRDSYRLGHLTELSLAADNLYRAAVRKHHLDTPQYKAMQAKIYRAALKMVGQAAPRDSDG